MTEMQEVPATQELSNKELNFRALEQQMKQERARAVELEQRFAQERAAREELERKISEREPEEDTYSEPYVDEKRLEKKLAKHEQKTIKMTQNEINKAVQQAIQEERKSNWLKQNADFYDVLKHADKFANAAPDLAESILEMPDSFERQKLVYANIKALGVHKEPPKEPSIQEKIEANRRGAYYQPSGMANAPYSPVGDFSPAGQKAAYDKMQELKRRNNF
jgi:hypothetical protein